MSAAASYIAAAGKFEQGDALPEEAGDELTAGMKRLRFHFNRRDAGRLRQLVDLINREG